MEPLENNNHVNNFSSAIQVLFLSKCINKNQKHKSQVIWNNYPGLPFRYESINSYTTYRIIHQITRRDHETRCWLNCQKECSFLTNNSIIISNLLVCEWSKWQKKRCSSSNFFSIASECRVIKPQQDSLIDLWPKKYSTELQVFITESTLQTCDTMLGFTSHKTNQNKCWQMEANVKKQWSSTNCSLNNPSCVVFDYPPISASL